MIESALCSIRYGVTASLLTYHGFIERLQSNRSNVAQNLSILDPNDLLRLLRNFRVMRDNDKRLPELRSTFHQQPHRI